MINQTLFEELIDKIKSNNSKLIKGETLLLDISSFFPRLSGVLPGFVKGDQIIITASSGVGKSRFSRFMFVKLPIALAQSDSSSIKPKIFLNSLEETPEKVATTFILQYLKEKHNLQLDYYKLLYPKIPHSIEVLNKIEEGWDYYKKIEKYLEVVSIHQPFGFYSHVRQYLSEIGTFYEKDKPIEIGQKWDRYEYHDPNDFVIAISDNINNYHAESGYTWYDTIKKFSAYYSRGLLGLKCGVINVMIQQQASDKERIDARADTFLLEKKLEPSLDGLGDIKITQRDALIVLGLFDPARYEIIDTHNGWDLNRMNGKYRSIHILKLREGAAINKMLSCYADLSRDYFQEMPTEISEQNYRLFGL